MYLSISACYSKFTELVIIECCAVLQLCLRNEPIVMCHVTIYLLPIESIIFCDELCPVNLISCIMHKFFFSPLCLLHLHSSRLWNIPWISITNTMFVPYFSCRLCITINYKVQRNFLIVCVILTFRAYAITHLYSASTIASLPIK